MFLEKISILNFKNLAQCDLAFSPNINCFTGDNGSGKTNLIDAVHYLSMSKSAMGLTDGQSVRHGEDFFMLSGNYLLGEDLRREAVVCSFKRGGGKVLKRNGKEYTRLSEHIGLLPIVMVWPGDTALIHESGDERRRFLNGFLSQLDSGYLTTLVRYNHLLAERNRLLKMAGCSTNDEILEILDMQLSDAAAVIYARRLEIVEQMAPLVARYYSHLSGDRETVEIEYRSELANGDMASLLVASRAKDYAMGFTTCGVQRDDLRLEIMGYPVRKYGSQGQQKSMLIALKMAQFEILHAKLGLKPILLLDDVFDKLDMDRVEQLIAMVSGREFGQIFITDSNKVRLDGILERLGEDYKLFGVNRESGVEELL